MLKYLIVSSLLLMSCSQVYDPQEEPSYYELIQEPPTVKENPVYDVPSFSHFELNYDPLEFLIDNPPLELHHIYEIQWSDKWIAERVKERMIFEESEKKENK